jgi:hypothetical protein
MGMTMKDKWIFFTVLVLAATVFMSLTGDASALEFDPDNPTGTNANFGKELYEFFFDTVLGGFIGFVAMGAIMAMGIIQLVRGNWPVMLLSTAVVICIAKLEDILASLGCTLDDIGAAASNIGYLIW